MLILRTFSFSLLMQMWLILAKKHALLDTENYQEIAQQLGTFGDIFNMQQFVTQKHLLGMGQDCQLVVQRVYV